MPNTSINFGPSNDILDKRYLTSVSVSDWGRTAFATGLDLTWYMRCMVRVQRGLVNDGHVPLFGTRQYSGGTNQGFNCLYFGPNAPETAFRNRYVFFGLDSLGAGLGAVDYQDTWENMSTPKWQWGARSAEILDDDPRLLVWFYRLLSDNSPDPSTRTEIWTWKPGDSTYEQGDVIDNYFNRATAGSLSEPMYFGTDYWTGNRFFPGELGQFEASLADSDSLNMLTTAIKPRAWVQGHRVLQTVDSGIRVARQLSGPTDLAASPDPNGLTDGKPALVWSNNNQGGTGSTLSGGEFNYAYTAAYGPNFVFISENHGITLRPNRVTVSVMSLANGMPSDTVIKVRLINAQTNDILESSFVPDFVATVPSENTIDFLTVPNGYYTVQAGRSSTSILYGGEFVGKQLFQVSDSTTQGEASRTANTSILFSGSSTVLNGPQLQYWADSLSVSDSASLAFMARPNRSKLSGVDGAPTSATVFGTQAHTGTSEGICCKYFGPNAVETGYRNRFCIFARDYAGGYLGYYDATGSAASGTLRAIRSAEITDDAPRHVFLNITKTGSSTYECSIETRKTDGSSVETGDTVTVNFAGLRTGSAVLTVGSYTGASSSAASNFWYGEISDLMFSELSNDDWARENMVGGDKTYWTAGDPILYRPFTTPDDLSSGAISDTYPNFTWAGTHGALGSSLTGRSIGQHRFFSLNEYSDGQVVSCDSSSFTVNGYFDINTSATYYITVRLRSVTVPTRIYTRIVAISGTTPGPWEVTFANTGSEVIAQDWYTVTASIDSLGANQQYSCTSTRRIGVGHRIWVFGDEILRNTFLYNNSPLPHARLGNVTHTYMPALAGLATPSYGKYSSVLTTTGNNAYMTEITGRINAMLALTPGTTPPPVELVWLATQGDSLTNWLGDARSAEGNGSGSYLISDIAAALADHSALCSMFIHAHSHMSDVDVAADFGSGFKAQLDELYTGPTGLIQVVPNISRVSVVGAARRSPEVPAVNPVLDIPAVHALRKVLYDWAYTFTAGITKTFAAFFHDYYAGYHYYSQGSAIATLPLDSRAATRFGCAIGNAILPVADLMETLVSAQFASAAKDTILLRNFNSTLSTVTPGADAAVEISVDSGSSWSDTGFTSQVVSGVVQIKKSSGDWSGITAGALQVRYGYGAPYGIAHYSGLTPSSIYAQAYGGFLVSTNVQTAIAADAGWPISPLFTPLVVQTPLVSGVSHLLPSAGAGR